MNVEKYNKYARWYERERKASAIAVYSGDDNLIKEYDETLQFIKEQMNKAASE